MTADVLGSLRRRLAARRRIALDIPSARRAAVLVTLLGSPKAPDVLFFERTHDVLDHKGEICFPGGSAEPGDDGPLATALREAHEELALAPAEVQVVGMLDDVETHVSNYAITPVVGFIEGYPPLRPDALEVARIITVPLARLREPDVESVERRAWQGSTRLVYAFRFDGNLVWGATGRITHALVETLRDAP